MTPQGHLRATAARPLDDPGGDLPRDLAVDHSFDVRGDSGRNLGIDNGIDVQADLGVDNPREHD